MAWKGKNCVIVYLGELRAEVGGPRENQVSVPGVFSLHSESGFSLHITAFNDHRQSRRKGNER